MDGQLGLGHKDSVNIPTCIFLPTHEKITAVVTNDGSTFLRSESGQWYACGNNKRGPLGLGHKDSVNIPTLVLLSVNEKITAVVTNDGSTFLRSESGQWYACGDNMFGKLGLGHANGVYVPTLVLLSVNENITSVVTDGLSTFFISESGRLFVCGLNNYGQLGLGHKDPVMIPTLLTLPQPFCSSLTEKQTHLIHSLIEQVKLTNPMNIAQFIGELLLTYARDEISNDCTMALSLGQTLMRQQHRNYTACVRLITAELRPVITKLPATDDKLTLLCLWKIVHDAAFQKTVNETIAAHTSSSNTQNMQQLVK